MSESQYLAVAELQAGKAGADDIIQLGAALSSKAIKSYLSEEIQVGEGELLGRGGGAEAQKKGKKSGKWGGSGVGKSGGRGRGDRRREKRRGLKDGWGHRGGGKGGEKGEQV